MNGLIALTIQPGYQASSARAERRFEGRGARFRGGVGAGGIGGVHGLGSPRSADKVGAA